MCNSRPNSGQNEPQYTPEVRVAWVHAQHAWSVVSTAASSVLTLGPSDARRPQGQAQPPGRAKPVQQTSPILYETGEVHIACYVDDPLVVGDQQYVNDLINTLKVIFTVRDLGEPKTFLGMEIYHDKQNKTLSISQSTYIKNIAEKFNVQNNYKISTPMEPGLKLTEKDNKEEHNKDENKDNHGEIVTKYRSIIGSCTNANQT